VSGLHQRTLRFLGHTDIKETPLFAPDSITKNNWNFNLGLRADFYNGISIARSVQPREGVAYNAKTTGAVLRVPYEHTGETPFNEGLSVGCNYPVISALMASTISPCVTEEPLCPPLSPGARNEFHAGLEQLFGKHLVIDGEYIWKYTQRGFDFSILGDAPITFPLTVKLRKSKIPGYAIRANLPNDHGLTAYAVRSSVQARFFEPQVAHIQHQPFKRG